MRDKIKKLGGNAPPTLVGKVKKRHDDLSGADDDQKGLIAGIADTIMGINRDPNYLKGNRFAPIP